MLWCRDLTIPCRLSESSPIVRNDRSEPGNVRCDALPHLERIRRAGFEDDYRRAGNPRGKSEGLSAHHVSVDGGTLA